MIFRFYRYLCVFLIAVMAVTACNKDEMVTPDDPDAPLPIGEVLMTDTMVLDPSGYAPLTAVIEVSMFPEAGITDVQMRVIGQNGASSDVTKSFPVSADMAEIQVLGLYGGYENQVELSFYNENGALRADTILKVQTGPLSADLPAIDIDVMRNNPPANEMTIVSYYGSDGVERFPFTPFMYDAFGDVRWYLEYKDHPDLRLLNYQDGIDRLANGHLYFGDSETDKIYEVDMFGNVIDSWGMDIYGFHHEVLEKPDGNFLVNAEVKGAPTIEDYVIEIDRNTKAITNVWNLNESLDPERRAWFGGNAIDWMHINAVDYDASDNTILVSGRFQGVVKLTEDNDVVWILGTHNGWGMSGDGADLNQYLLTPLTAGDTAITDTLITYGFENHPDFEWNWYQHSPKVMPDGNLILFDNGDNRNYGGSGPGSYSRAVEFEIDETEMTVKQVWSYGKNRPDEIFSRIVSEVDYYPDYGSLVYSGGSINNGGNTYGKVIEVDYASRMVKSEYTIHPPEPFFIVTLHRSHFLSIYP